MSSIVRLLPKSHLSRAVGWLVHRELPAPLNQWAIRQFGNHYKINFSEAEKEIHDYKSIGDFFVRRLKPGVRPISDSWMVHPCDSQISEVGPIRQGSFVQAKDISYQISEILSSQEKAAQFEGGTHITYYLCPTDYHRVHVPTSGNVLEAIHVPGTLWPVNEWSVQRIPSLFAINERIIVWFETSYGPIAIIFVGATNVGKISLSFDSDLISNQGLGSQIIRKEYNPKISLQKGDELGCFHMGSTIVMLLPQGIQGNQDLLSWAGKKVQVGQSFIKASGK